MPAESWLVFQSSLVRHLWINGKRPDGFFWSVEGMVLTLAPGEIRGMTHDISSRLKSPGTFRLRYVVDEARSTEVTIAVR